MGTRRDGESAKSEGSLVRIKLRAVLMAATRFCAEGRTEESIDVDGSGEVKGK
jgi:hypothetical protein